MRKNIVTIALAVLVPASVLLALSAQGASTRPTTQPATAADAVRQFIELIISGDVDAAAKLAEGVSPADLKRTSEAVRSGKLKVSVADSKEDGDLAIVIVKVVQDVGAPEFSPGPVARVDGRWVLARDPEARLDEAGKKRLEALQKWGTERSQELRKAEPTTRPGNN